MWLQYFSLLLVILVALVVTAVLGYIYRYNIEAIAKDSLEEDFHKYGKNGSEVVTNEVDFMQSQVSRLHTTGSCASRPACKVPYT